MSTDKIIKYVSVAVLLTAFIVFSSLKIINVTRSTQAANERNGKVILIDPGHGGADPGAVSPKGTKESVLNMQVALYLKEYLLEEGFEVIMTRGDGDVPGADTGMTNDERKRIIASAECDMVVSIHMNKFSDTSVHGAETFYYEPSVESRQLAECIQISLKNELDSTNTRTIKGVTNLFVLKTSKAPSVLIECGYISNPTEEAKLNTPSYQRRIAFSVCCGILSYYNNQNPLQSTAG